MASKTTKRGAAKSRKPAGRAASAGRARKTTSARRAAAAKAANRKPGRADARTVKKPGQREKAPKPSPVKSGSSAPKSAKLEKKSSTPRPAPPAAGTSAEKAAGATKSHSAKPAGGKSAAPPSKTGKSGKPAKSAGKSRKQALGASAEESALDAINGATPDKDGYILFKGRRVRVISTKNVKKRRSLTASEKAERAREAEAKAEPDKPVRTKLSKKELDHYRDLLLLLRSQKLGDLSAKEAEALQSNGGNLSHMPIHMADIGSDAYEQDFTLGLAESDRKLIREIDDALGRIENKTYGMCQLTSKPIPKSRLNAKPWAKYTVEAARMVENGQVA